MCRTEPPGAEEPSAKRSMVRPPITSRSSRGGYHRPIMKLFFYELHEGATDLLTDAVLVSDREYTPEAFAALVLAARAAVVDTFEEDTLVEAIARELERSHGFTYAGDEKLTPA